MTRMKTLTNHEVPEKDTCTVYFSQAEKQVRVSRGATLLHAAEKTGIFINASCNGKGSCGKCRLMIASGQVESAQTPFLSDKEKRRGYVLACQAEVTGDVHVVIPEETLEKKLKAEGMGKEATDKLFGLVNTITPMMERVTLKLDPPTLDDSISDLDRLIRSLKKEGVDTGRMNTGLKVMRELANAIRLANWEVNAFLLPQKGGSALVRVLPVSETAGNLGLAVDLGTTSIVVYVVDMKNGKILSAASGRNPQASCGDDVINRIVCAEREGVKKLQRLALTTINHLTEQALAGLGEKASRIDNVVVSGNTTMIHLLLGIEPRYIRREPYIPGVAELPVLTAAEIGLKAASHAGVFIMPGPASYVGGDIVAGVLYTGVHRSAALNLFIDVGINGEIVLGNNTFLMTAACSAGPAFEGGGIRWGMRAEDGAIEKITLDPDTLAPEYTTVAGKPARGICGSGMIDLMSEMLLKKVVGQDGRFKHGEEHPRMTVFNEEPALIIEYGEKLGMEEDIIFTQSDIKSLILSKAAVYAGFTSL